MKKHLALVFTALLLAPTLARAQGLVVAALRGGFEAWFDAGYPVETMSDGLPPLEDA